MMRGLILRTLSWSTPSLALTSGRKFSTTTSALATSRLNTSSPFGFFRFSDIARLLRCKFWKSEPWRGPPSCSPPASSRIASILMTLAPQSASWRTQVGPARTRVRSRTVKRDRACEARGMDIRANSMDAWGVLDRTIQENFEGKFNGPVQPAAGQTARACRYAPATERYAALDEGLCVHGQDLQIGYFRVDAYVGDKIALASRAAA